MKKIFASISLLFLLFSSAFAGTTKTPVECEYRITVIKTKDLMPTRNEIERKLGHTFVEGDGEIGTLTLHERQQVEATLIGSQVHLFSRWEGSAGIENGKIKFDQYASIKNPDGSEIPVGAGYRVEFQVFEQENATKNGLLVELKGDFGNEGSHGFEAWKRMRINREIENGGAVTFVSNGMFVMLTVASNHPK